MTPRPEIARQAFGASELPAPPRTAQDALHYITTLLSMLPPGEQAGYLLKQAGENIAPLPDGAIVSVGRICYPNGKLVKVMNDVPNGGPQWVEEAAVESNRYYAYTGAFVSREPPSSPPPSDDLLALRTRVTVLETRTNLVWEIYAELAKQIAILNQQIEILTNRPAPLQDHRHRVGFWMTSGPK